MASGSSSQVPPPRTSRKVYQSSRHAAPGAVVQVAVGRHKAVLEKVQKGNRRVKGKWQRQRQGNRTIMSKETKEENETGVVF